MKKFLTILALIFVAFTANAQNTNSKATQRAKTSTMLRTFKNKNSKTGNNKSSARPKVKEKSDKKGNLTRTITINYKELVDCLTKMDLEDPERTRGELDLLKDNITNHLMPFVQDGILTMVLDEDNGLIYVGGELITDDVYTLWPEAWGKDVSTSTKMYRQISYSLKSAKSYGIYEKVFTETWSDN